MCDNVENMSSKKYDANIGTTRHARATQHAVLLDAIFLSVCFTGSPSLYWPAEICTGKSSGAVFLADVGKFEPEAFLPVFYLEQKAEYEGQYSE